MTTQGRINPETLSAFLEGLPDLLESLRAQGYGLGTRQHVAAHELVGSLFARGGLPPTFVELDEWLAPLICFTPAQQEDFRERYLQWLVERGLVDKPDMPPDPRPIEIPPPPPPPPEPPFIERIARRVSANRRPLIAAGAAVVMAAALFVAYQLGAAYLKEEDPTQVVVHDPPVPQPAPVPLPSDDVEVETYLPPPPPPRATPTPDVGLAWDADKPEGGKTEAPDLSKVELNDPPPPAGFWVRNYTTLVALALAPPFAALGLWQVLRRRRRRKDSERFGEEKPRYDKLKVRGARERVFQSAALRPVARGLRHYLSVESRQLDARSTVRASAGRGGLFTPVYGRRRTLPEYLVLIDRVGFGDQLAQLNSDIVARLSEHDVYLDTYYFHGDPRRCREGGPDSPQLSLSDLAARHPDHYLLIFSDGTGLLSTTTGRPEPFVGQLLYWRGRALLTPVPRLEWEYREWALEREGLKVLPASLAGLRLLVDVVNTGGRTARAPDFDETPPYPDILREQPSLWKERDEPPSHQTRRLVTHLRRYLGPKCFELLCACAVYPVMQWGVTLFLAYELLGRREVDELLPRLLRLPWFRNGTMPQWLRRVLVRELPRARRRLVRERLEHLLLAFLEDPERGLRPRSAEESDARDAAARASLLTRLSERLAAWRLSRRLRRRLEHAPARSPLAEPVFLNYITDNQSAEALPAPVRNRLFRRGVAAFGLRLAPAAALVTVAVLTALLLLLLERPTDDIYTPGAPDDLMSRLLSQPPARTTDPDFVYTPTTGRRGRSYDIKVNAGRLGAYDFTDMSIRPAAGAKSGLTLELARPFKSALYISLTVAPDAPLGPNELHLYDGDRLRARLPFTVYASDQPPPTPTPVPSGPCPDIKIVGDGFTSERYSTIMSVSVRNMPPGTTPLSYKWSTSGVLSIVGDRVSKSIEVARPVAPIATLTPAVVSVEVAGRPLPPGCSNAATYSFDGTTPPDTSQRSKLTVTVEPQSITVCPSNSKLNEPPDSIVSVSTSLNLGLGAGDISVSGGKISHRGGSASMNLPLYDWNLSGMSPGSYTVTAAMFGRSDIPPGSASVTVKGCPASAPPNDPAPAVLSAVAQATNDIRAQVTAMNVLSKDMARRRQITDGEALALTGAATRLGSALNVLGDSIGVRRGGQGAASQSTLASQVNAVYTAMKDLESQIVNVKDPMARAELGASLNVMQKYSSLLNPLRRPTGN